MTRQLEILALIGVLLITGCSTPSVRNSGTNFTLRCQATGVVRCFGFDSQAETDPYISPPWGQKQNRAMVVTDVTASGAGSLRFEIPPYSGSDSSGTFWLNFADDFSIQFGEGDEFFIQWRQRFSPEFLDTIYPGGGGWKQFIVGEGDRPGHSTPGCTQLELVVVNLDHLGSPAMYHSCGGKDGQYEGLFSTGSTPYYPNEWMTFQLHVKIGTWYKNDQNYHGDSIVQLWVGREGRASELVVDLNPDPAKLFGLSIPGTGTGYDLANNNPHARYGKLGLLPYNTNKDPSADHPTGYTWYDDLIISRTRIADPN